MIILTEASQTKNHEAGKGLTLSGQKLQSGVLEKVEDKTKTVALKAFLQ